MLLAVLERLPWQLTCLLFASVATATITPSNSSTAGPRFQGTLPLKHADGVGAQIADLVPLTREAAQRTIEGNLYNTNFSNVANITNGEIAYISCNPQDYPGLVDSQRVFEDAYKNANISGIILYSTATDYCDYEQNGSQDMMQSFPVLSMTNRSASATLLNAIDDLPLSMKYFVQVQVRGDASNNNGNFVQSNPLGPSPSTAVAMIILYSITGIITALFLVIIITGAIRAHRHPERYGPRNVLGRPRQSRARGLGRAILETIPIVKFGEKEAPKPTDVELGSTAEARDVNGVQADGGVAITQTAVGTEPADATSKTITEVTETPQNATRAPVEEHEEGIAPAQPLAAAAALGADRSSNDENLGCSICTEDFEKGQDLRVLPCDHKFHPECVDPWLLNVSGTCPLCRVDLRPVTSHDSTASQNPDDLAPPLNPEAETSQRRRTAFRDILSLRQRPNASAEERISALRRFREQRRNQSDDVAAGSANGSAEDVENTRDRRSKRMSVRLSDVFTSRTRRERRDESPTQHGEASRSAALPPPPPTDGSPVLDAETGANVNTRQS